ncbi:unnamed protein product [Eruca vesicaria subsp. sativa]|uniref:Uncharacterized protein n=1 Tax=Eruca vesicaria subsp. sativa TaxID=29727 RepID=A0ABC8L759_ERUVS|nr:unnamed protein product [Eruca vesicaria subsp. sativa]
MAKVCPINSSEQMLLLLMHRVVTTRRSSNLINPMCLKFHGTHDQKMLSPGSALFKQTQLGEVFS